MSTLNSTDPYAVNKRTGKGGAVVNAEDLASTLTMLEHKDTPAFSLCKKETAESVRPTWFADELKSPKLGGVPEGYDFASFDNKFENTAPLTNTIQIFGNTWHITDVQEAVKKATKQDKAECIARCIAELKRDVEFSILSNQDSQEQSNSSNYLTRGLGKWTDPALSDVPVQYRTPSTSILSTKPTENTIVGLIQSMYTAGVTDDITLVAGAALRTDLSSIAISGSSSETYSRAYNVNVYGNKNELTYQVDIFKTAHGMVRVINGNPKCMPTPNTGFLFNPKYLSFATLKPLEIKDIDNNGGGERGYVKLIGALKTTPKSLGKISY